MYSLFRYNVRAKEVKKKQNLYVQLKKFTHLMRNDLIYICAMLIFCKAFNSDVMEFNLSDFFVIKFICMRILLHK